MPPPPHLSKIFRRLLKLALGLLVLAAAFCGGRVWVDSRGRALMPNLPARVAPARPQPPPQDESPGVPVSSLPVFAGIFSTDPAEQEAAGVTPTCPCLRGSWKGRTTH